MPLPHSSLEPDGYGLPSAPPAFPVSAAPAPINPPVPPTLPMPGMAPPQMPTFHPPTAPTQQPMQSRLMELLPILIGGLHKPEDIGAALRGLQEGRDRKLQQQEHAQQTQERRAKEAADFYGRAASDAMNFDDPAQFERWRQSIAPLAQFHGIDANAFQFNQTKGTKAKQSRAVAALEAAEKRDPSLAQREDARLTTPDYPEGVEFRTIRSWAFEAKDKSGKTILPAPKPDALTPNNPEEQFYAQYAKEHGAASFVALPTAEQVKAREQWAAGGRQTNTPDVGTFSDYVTRKYGKNPTPEQITQARKDYGQADDRAPGGTGGDIDYEAIAGAIEAGLQPPNINTRSQYGMRVQSVLAKRGYDLSQAVTDWTATQKHISTMNGPQQLRLNQSINALPDLLDSVGALAAQWKGGRFPVLNRANLAVAKGGAYGPEVAAVANQLEVQIADVVSDLGNIYMGGNSPTDHALELAKKSLSSDWDSTVLKSMVELAKKNVAIRRNSVNNTGVAGASAANPYAPAAAPAGDAVNPFRKAQ